VSRVIAEPNIVQTKPRTSAVCSRCTLELSFRPIDVSSPKTERMTTKYGRRARATGLGQDRLSLWSASRRLIERLVPEEALGPWSRAGVVRLLPACRLAGLAACLCSATTFRERRAPRFTAALGMSILVL
jgi:hypothetical protein